MIAYFDTSAFLKLVLDEPGSERARELWRLSRVAVSSVLLYAECRAGLAMAHRVGRLSDVAQARKGVDDLWAKVHSVIADGRLVCRAGELAEEFRLRGYDAVHLASAEWVRGPDLIFVSADRRQGEAAAALGLATTCLA